MTCINSDHGHTHDGECHCIVLCRNPDCLREYGHDGDCLGPELIECQTCGHPLDEDEMRFYARQCAVRLNPPTPECAGCTLDRKLPGWRESVGGVRIELGNGGHVVVDTEDLYKIIDYRWYRFDSHGISYAKSHAKSLVRGGRGRVVLMHRLIMDAPKGMQVDHINHDGLDNRRSNLRLATHSENLRNSRPKRGNKFKGVTFCRRLESFPWAAALNGHIGYYATDEEAARAYDAEARKVYGDRAYLNFPDSTQLPEARKVRSGGPPRRRRDEVPPPPPETIPAPSWRDEEPTCDDVYASIVNREAVGQ